MRKEVSCYFTVLVFLFAGVITTVASLYSVSSCRHAKWSLFDQYGHSTNQKTRHTDLAIA